VNFIFVFIGGGLGALLRYVSTQFISKTIATGFPAGTLFVNSIGALCIGFFYKTFETFTVPAELRLFIMTGFLGGYTTFSSYSLETVQCLSGGNIKGAVINILMNNVLCIVFVTAGIWISKTLIK
jgi:CrcB protein